MSNLGPTGSTTDASGPATRLPSRPRLSRHGLFQGVAALYGQRSSCPRANVGVVAVREGRIVAAGYCGAPKGRPHCMDVGCDMLEGHCIRSVHAEANMVAWAARTGTSLEGTDVYCTHEPCMNCAKLLSNTGISRLWYGEHYTPNGTHILRSVGVGVTQWA